MSWSSRAAAADRAAHAAGGASGWGSRARQSGDKIYQNEYIDKLLRGGGGRAPRTAAQIKASLKKDMASLSPAEQRKILSRIDARANRQGR